MLAFQLYSSTHTIYAKFQPTTLDLELLPGGRIKIIMKNYLLVILLSAVVLVTSVLMINYRAKAEEQIMTNKKVLVAYFSATGTTEKLANKLAKVTNADLFKITPEQPYTADDLNWMDKQSRSSVEMKDRNCRPAIASKLDNMNEYDVIFVGFPIWWYREPSIIDTFMESYDFTGKTIIPFATSGGSPIGNSGEIMQSLAPNAKVFAGKCFPSNTTEEALKDWAEEWL